MSEEKSSPTARDYIKRIPRGVVKAIPWVGPVIDHVIFGTLEKKAAEEESKKVHDFLARISDQPGGHEGGSEVVITRLDEQVKLPAGVKRELKTLVELIQNPEKGELTQTVELAIGRVIAEQQPVYFSPQWPVTDPEIFGREEELKLLDEAWADREGTNVYVLVAWGGVGKTALVNHWQAQRMQPERWRGAERVLGWSFYSQGAEEGRQASGDEFVRRALAELGDKEMAESASSATEKGERLARLIREKRTLLLLDGLEPLQEPPGLAAGRPGMIKDPGVRALVRALAAQNPGLCVVSTRLAVVDLKPYEGAAVKSRDLDNLTEKAGAEYLASLGVKGAKKERLAASREFEGHALGLTLLGNFLALYREGDIRRRDEIPELMAEKEHGHHARRVLKLYEKWFEGKPELNVLLMLGLFDRPAEMGAIEAIRDAPPIENLTDALADLTLDEWVDALKSLRDARLLAKSTEGEPVLDTHPLVREYFGERLQKANPKAFREGHNRLFAYYRALPEKDLPDTIEEMRPLYRAVLHGARAGRHKEAFDEVYYRRVNRGNEAYSVHSLGAIGDTLSAISGFFDPPWRKPVDDLEENVRSFLLNAAAFRLRGLGRLREAVEPMTAGLDASVTLGDWKNASADASNLSELQLTLGQVEQAVTRGEESVAHADRSRDEFERFSRRTTHAEALFHTGRVEEAAALFREAESMQKERQPEYPLLYSVAGYRFCDLILSRGDAAEACRRAGQTLGWFQEKYPLLSIALDNLTLGRAALDAALAEDSSEFAEVGRELDEAVAGLTKAGVQDYLPRGLLARAELYRAKKEFGRAQADLDEAYEIATLGEMRLYECDVHVECCRLLLAMVETGERLQAEEMTLMSPFALFGAAEHPLRAARGHLDKAAAMVRETGYHLRDPEILLETAHVLHHEGKAEQAREKLAEAKAKIDEMGLHRWDRVARAIGALIG